MGDVEAEDDEFSSSAAAAAAAAVAAAASSMMGFNNDNNNHHQSINNTNMNNNLNNMNMGLNMNMGMNMNMGINMNLNSSNNNNNNNHNQPTFHGSRSASHIGRKPAFGQTCSMKTLLQDGILQVGEEVLTLEHDGNKFQGDLRKDGTIMMRDLDGSPHIYATPVAWANHCCKMLNPESKPLNAWSSIRFKGKRLDSYKLKWYRAQKKPINTNNNNSGAAGSNNLNSLVAGLGNNSIGGVNMNLPNNASSALNNSIIRNLQQQQNPSSSGSGRLVVHNPITNYFPQYENPLKNKKLIKSVLISNNMDNDCKRLVAKSLDLSVDPCIMTQQINDISDGPSNVDINSNSNATSNNNVNGDEAVVGPHDSNEAVANHTSDNVDENNHCTNLSTTVINYEQLGTRGPHNTHDPNTMIKCIPFSAVDRIQPFNVTVSTNTLLLVDFHSHLVSGEVAGYLAGSWDANQHVLTVTQAFPCRTSLDDESTASGVEDEIRQDIEKRNLTLVGWYHSHQGKYSNHPTIKDIQNQMEYQITMKESVNGYLPCIGLICSPHDIRTEEDLSPSFQIYWVMPPPEHLVNHYGRPMQMYYSVTRDLFLTQDLLLEMRLLANYFSSKEGEFVDFKATYEYNNRITCLDKLRGSIKPKLPKDLQESEYPDDQAVWKAAVDHFWKFLKNLVVPANERPSESQNDAQTEDENPVTATTDGESEDKTSDDKLQEPGGNEVAGLSDASVNEEPLAEDENPAENETVDDDDEPGNLILDERPEDAEDEPRDDGPESISDLPQDEDDEDC